MQYLKENWPEFLMYAFLIGIILLVFCAISHADEPEIIDYKGNHGYVYKSTDPINDEFSNYPTKSIVFYGDDEKQLGSIDWSTGKLIFTGNFDKSAKIFFQYLLYNDILSACKDKK